MGDKSVETLGSKIEFLSILVTFSPFPRIQRRNLVYPGSMVGPQGGVYRDFFTFKAFKECLPHFHSTQFSLLHHAYKCFSI